MRTKLVIACALAMMALSACSSDSSGGGGGGGGSGPSNNPAVKAAEDKCTNTPVEEGNDLRYVMSESTNGSTCTTGCQIFHSYTEYCEALRDDSLNNNCAKAGRDQAYEDNCR